MALITGAAALVLVGALSNQQLIALTGGNQLLVALAGGAVSFLWVLLCSTLFVRRLVTLAGRLAAPTGVPGHLAARNATRNPGRTSVTAAALLIGVTLVSLMMTGASSARLALDQMLAQNHPVDMAVLASPESARLPAAGSVKDPETRPSQVEAVRALD